ncbi:MAG: trimeric intracellular cation channel family protein [Lentisphaerae bacterium]|nr:trimeric intracellular cation channel family protein [Lentisphaerota bacterium]
MDLQPWLHGLDYLGTAVFAVSGALAAGRKQMDLFGVAVLAMVTAVGGGTLRDVILDAAPVFWVAHPVYVWIALAAALTTVYAVRHFRLPGNLLVVADALGLAAVTVIGTEKALAAGTAGTVAVLMGIMTAVVGGIVRDLLAGEIPLILRREIYATAALCGALTYTALAAHPSTRVAALPASIAVTLGLRLAAIRWHLSLPVFRSPHA